MNVRCWLTRAIKAERLHEEKDCFSRRAIRIFSEFAMSTSYGLLWHYWLAQSLRQQNSNAPAKRDSVTTRQHTIHAATTRVGQRRCPTARRTGRTTGEATGRTS